MFVLSKTPNEARWLVRTMRRRRAQKETDLSSKGPDNLKPREMKDFTAWSVDQHVVFTRM